MTTTTNGTTTSPTKTPKKTNLLDHNSIKHLLDETVTEIVTSGGYKEDVRMTDCLHQGKECIFVYLPSYILGKLKTSIRIWLTHMYLKCLAFEHYHGS
ncbi:hypothetical protein L1987_78816 [Smallanthus sonchifolius]|uniref:Uncharacterized protein n=1 Tax=Smallanthus sonchifolius TaxID=185202 RepID=A0ACB8ZER9_9ASTR|nr:hypothetical protein L1987_78816 [Smallanthus sonchifolius]